MRPVGDRWNGLISEGRIISAVKRVDIINDRMSYNA
jgi:hypothetical protein